MQDFIPIGTGNSRYLKSVENFKTLYPTYDAFAAALVAGTLPVDFNGINEAGIVQKGMALNKYNLLKDATAALYGLDETAVPDDVFKKTTPWRVLGEYTTAGSYTFTVPENVSRILALVIPGGGSGGVNVLSALTSSSTSYITGAGGGSCGYPIVVEREVTLGDEFNLVVGAGGKSVSVTTSDSEGNTGGSSSFDGETTSGGNGGKYGYDDFGVVTTLFSGASGYTSSDGHYASCDEGDNTTSCPYGGTTDDNDLDRRKLDVFFNAICRTDFSYFAAGGLALLYSKSSEALGTLKTTATTFPNGKKSSASAVSSTGKATATKGTDIGCGGSGAVGIGGATSAAGCDGAVFIIGRV